MNDPPVRLKALLTERHWQKYSTFCREYDKAANGIDPHLAGSYPSRAQLHRWMSGQVKRLPYPDACRVLEQMFPGWSAKQLLEPCTDEHDPADPVTSTLRIVAEGVAAPDAARVAWGSPSALRTGASGQMARVEDHDDEGLVGTIGRATLALGKMLRLSPDETAQLASLAGNVVDLDLRVDIDIASDGWARVTYHHHLFNMSTRPLTRLAREVWFENTEGPLTIESACMNGDRLIAIQRQHDTAHSAKFAVQLSPPLQPGDSTTLSYTCSGGQFVSDHYWRQALPRYTRHFTIRLRHRGAGQLASCTALEEHPDGAENTANEDLLWDYDGDDVLVTLTRDYLRPNQAMTLRWEVRRDPA
jgi:hypothetical protein